MTVVKNQESYRHNSPLTTRLTSILREQPFLKLSINVGAKNPQILKPDQGVQHIVYLDAPWTFDLQHALRNRELPIYIDSVSANVHALPELDHS